MTALEATLHLHLGLLSLETWQRAPVTSQTQTGVGNLRGSKHMGWWENPLPLELQNCIFGTTWSTPLSMCQAVERMGDLEAINGVRRAMRRAMENKSTTSF